MAAVVGVHGIAQQQSGPARQQRIWIDAFRHGLRQVESPESKLPSLEVPFYGHLFRKGSPYLYGAALPDMGLLEDKAWDDDEITFVAEALDDLASNLADAGLGDPAQRSPALGPPALIPPPLLRGLAMIDRHWGTGRGLLLVGVLRQVNAYLFVPKTGERIRQIVTDKLGDDTRVLVGHSLGSVIAYDLLIREEAHHVQALVTLGSPLRISTVRSALPSLTNCASLPGNDLQWWNVHDPWDVVTAGYGLAPDARDISIRNGRSDPHALSAYLGRRETAQVILRGVAA